MSWVLFFDGDCAFCSKSVRLVARLDKGGRIAFAPLQGDLARRAGLSGYAEDAGGSVVLQRESDGRIFIESDALVELAGALGGGWRVFGVARYVPKCVRDALYRWIARNRFHFMGRTDACVLPDEEFRKRLRN